MLNASKNREIQFKKMSGAGNDFIIIDCREFDYQLTQEQIALLSKRNVIGCDQFIILKNSDKSDCLMKIYNSDGSESGACGNATRCVAGLISEEKSKNSLTIETIVGILSCQINDKIISVEMSEPKFFDDNFKYQNHDFFLADIGNPHAVSFITETLSDAEFFKIGKEIESHPNFVNKTNVEFAKIIDKNIIEVRVFERGAGETLACGSGACAVGALAIKNGLVEGNEVITRFKGGEIKINWNGIGSRIVMSGDYDYIFDGVLDPDFL